MTTENYTPKSYSSNSLSNALLQFDKTEDLYKQGISKYKNNR